MLFAYQFTCKTFKNIAALIQGLSLLGNNPKSFALLTFEGYLILFSLNAGAQSNETHSTVDLSGGWVCNYEHHNLASIYFSENLSRNIDFQSCGLAS